MTNSTRKTVIESCIAATAALLVYLPFLALQYDTNGIVEALAVESGDLFHKNHLLYRPLGYAVYHALQTLGYTGRAVVVLQIINAVCGAATVAFVYAAYKKASQNTFAAAAGAVLIGCSFIHWLYSTDISYITAAAMFAAASMLVLQSGSGVWSAIAAGLLTTGAVMTWQGAIFLVPALGLLTMRVRRAFTFAAAACIAVGAIYVSTAFAREGFMSPVALTHWFTSYGEHGTIPMWGKWGAERPMLALSSGVRSIVPTPLAVSLSEITSTTQRGRILVDAAIAALVALFALAAWKTRRRDLLFVAAFLCFAPFIIWWDPYVPKWFAVPNLFLGAYVATSLARWRGHSTANAVIAGSLALIAGANFITIIRPRSRDLGEDRRIAQCVAEHTTPQDVVLAAQWGWPDYLEYLHKRQALMLINHYPDVDETLANLRAAGGAAYIVDPQSYSEEHISWLREQSGPSREDMIRLAGAQAFECEGLKFFSVVRK